jgi:hypothetical protein
MGTCVLHSKLHVVDMDDVYIIPRYPWMESMGTININVQNNFKKHHTIKRKSHCKIFILLNIKRLVDT